MGKADETHDKTDGVSLFFLMPFQTIDSDLVFVALQMTVGNPLSGRRKAERKQGRKDEESE